MVMTKVWGGGAKNDCALGCLSLSADMVKQTLSYSLLFMQKL